MTWKPHVTVAAVIAQQDRFLLVEEHIEGRLVLNQPAGHLEPGEGLLEAVVRETLEETARDFVPEALVGLYRWASPADGRTFLRLGVTGNCGAPDPNRALDSEIVRTVWLTEQQLRAQGARLRSPMVLRCIEDHTAGRRYPLELIRDLAAGGLVS